MTRAAITFDTGALISLERRMEHAMKIYVHAKERGFIVATPNVTIAEWWRGRSDRREAVYQGLLVEPPSEATVKLAGLALVRLPRSVEVVALPPMAIEDGALRAAAGDVETALSQRSERCREVVRQVAPEVVVTELFPFGRHRFIGELLALLDGTPNALHACSLRDILVSARDDQAAFDQRALALLNDHYDVLFVHTDRRLVELSPLFSTAELAPDVVVTGFVGEFGGVAKGALRDEILVSAGGGRVGGPLYRAAAAAQRTLWPETRRPMRIGLAAELAVATYTVTQCGNNTALELFAASGRALVVPFSQGAENEQMARARRMEELGRVMVLGEAEPSAASMVRALRELASFSPRSVEIDVGGAAETAATLRALADAPPSKLRADRTARSS